MSATVLYDTLVGDATKTINLSSTSQLGYPTSDMYTVLGPVYLPRIYGKDLTAFELASSGKVSVTLQDTHAFDLDYNPSTTTSSIAAVNGESFQLSADGGATNITMNTQTKDLELTTPSNVVFNVDGMIMNITGSVSSLIGGDYTLTVGGATQLHSTSNIELTSSAGSAVLATASSNVTLVLDHTACNLVGYALHDIVLSSSNAFQTTAQSNASVTSLAGAVSLSAAGSTSTMQLDASGATLYALSNIGVTTSNAFSLYSTKVASLSSASNINLSAASGASLLGLSSTGVAATASNYTFNATDAQGGYTYKIASNDILQVTADKVIVNTDLDVYGVVNSIAVQNTELHVEDKTIQLAHPSDGQTITDGPFNSDAGIVIAGLPASASNMDPTEAAALYEKSFKWNYGVDGIGAMLTNSGINTESFWELKGGRLQLTSTKSSGKKITFALRINEHDELEFVKMWDDATNTHQVRRIAKFGRTIL